MFGFIGEAEFAGLPDEVRNEVVRWMEFLQPLVNEHKGVMKRLKGIAERMGVSLPCARLRLDQLRHGREMRGELVTGWKTQINFAKAPSRDGLPKEFRDWYKTLCERNQRNSRLAYKVLIHTWKNTDEAIPGYATPPPAGKGGVPDGWTYGNLRRYAPSKFETTVARQGRSAAAVFRPLVLTTRVGLSVGEYYLFDDLEHDLKVNFVGVNKQALRPLELSALDLFSGCKIAYGCKPTIEGDDGAKEKIKERDMRFLLAYLLTVIGYRKHGTTLVVEHGTAAIREDIRRVLFNCTSGAIAVQDSGIEGAPALAGWYEGRSKGNFRLKAALESHHNLTHNVTQLLPGQMGLDREHSPEELHGRDKINKMLLRAVESLPPEKAELLRFPFLHYQQFCGILDAVYRYINARMDHELEGWEAAGLVAQEYRLDAASKHWLPAETLSSLSGDKQAAISALIEQPGLTRCRKLAPVEVWNRGRKDLIRLPVWTVPEILGEGLAVERRVQDTGTFEFEDRELSPAPFVFLARAVNKDGYEVILREHETYKTFINPFDQATLVVCDARGGFVGTCRRIQTPCKNDPEALMRAMGDSAHSEAVRLDEYRARHQGDVEKKDADEKWNKAVIAGAPVLAGVSPEKAMRQADREERRLAALAESAIAANYTGRE